MEIKLLQSNKIYDMILHMEKNSGKKWLRSILLIYIALAVPGSFAFSMLESFHLEETAENRENFNGNHTLKAYTMDWTTVTIAPITRIREPSSQHRSGLSQHFIYATVCFKALCFEKPYFQFTQKNNILISKNNIPLKLLI